MLQLIIIGVVAMRGRVWEARAGREAMSGGKLNVLYLVLISDVVKMGLIKNSLASSSWEWAMKESVN